MPFFEPSGNAMWNRNQRRRKAIKQSEIRKKFHSMGPFMEGFRVRRDAKSCDLLHCPYELDSQDGRAWLAGANFAIEQERSDERSAK